MVSRMVLSSAIKDPPTVIPLTMVVQQPASWGRAVVMVILTVLMVKNATMVLPTMTMPTMAVKPIVL